MNPQYDALLDAYYSAIPRSERINVLRQIVHTLSDELVFLGLSYTPAITFTGARLRNVTGPALRSVTGWNAVDWDIE